jgi:hypothetical protein
MARILAATVFAALSVAGASAAQPAMRALPPNRPATARKLTPLAGALADVPVLAARPARQRPGPPIARPVLGAAARVRLTSVGMTPMDFQSNTVTVNPAHPTVGGVTLYADGPLGEFSAGGGAGYIEIQSAPQGTDLYTGDALAISLENAPAGALYLIDVSVSAAWDGTGKCDWKMSADTLTFQYQTCKNAGPNAFAQQDVLVAVQGQGGSVTDLYIANEHDPSQHWIFWGATVTRVN